MRLLDKAEALAQTTPSITVAAAARTRTPVSSVLQAARQKKLSANQRHLEVLLARRAGAALLSLSSRLICAWLAAAPQESRLQGAPDRQPRLGSAFF